MAHTCPECWKTCHCQGDWDDIDFGDWYGCECDCQKFPDMSDFANDDDAEQSMHPTSGIQRGLEDLSTPEENPAPEVNPTPPTCG